MSKKDNPFSSKVVQIWRKDCQTKTPVKWKGNFVSLADSFTRLSNKSDSLVFKTRAAETGDAPNWRRGLNIAGEGNNATSSRLDFGGGDDEIIIRTKGGMPLGTFGDPIYLGSNNDQLVLGEGNDRIESNNITLRDSFIYGGKGNDSVMASQYIDVERWYPNGSRYSVLDLGEGNDTLSATVLMIGGKVLMGEGKDVITGLIDDSWTTSALGRYSRRDQYPYIDLGSGDDIINLKYGVASFNDRQEGISRTYGNNASYVEINGGEGIDKIFVSGGVFENVDVNGLQLFKYSANGFDFYYKLTSIEEVAYA